MKKTDWAILTGTAVYSTLFYQQHAGINCLLFTLFLIVAFLIVFKELRSDRGWFFYSFCALFSSFFVFLYSSDLAFFSLLISWLLLSARAVNDTSTVITNLFAAAFSVITSVGFFIKRVHEALSIKKAEPGDKRSVKVFIYLVAVALLILFFFLYKQANPLFEKYTRWINLDFISVRWFFFTTWGFLFLYGLFRHLRIRAVDVWEARQEDQLVEVPVTATQTYLGQGFIFLFVLLNLMLLFINVLDINFLYLGSGLPEGITHKQFVHKGVNNLIFSILLGITIILYVFKGAMNFDGRGKILKGLVFLWLIQNTMMVFSTALRNHMYIMDALLTYKRIGVYYWLILALSGLVTTFIKIKLLRRNWFLMRSNSIVALGLLVSSSAVEWDLFISWYNISRASQVASLDKKYLLSLSEANIGLLYPMRNHPKFEIDSIWHYQYPGGSNRKQLDEKIYSFLANTRLYKDWRSYNIRQVETHRWINSNQHLIDTLDLSEGYFPAFKYYTEFKYVKALYLPLGAERNDSTILEVAKFPRLEYLGTNYFTDDDIPILNHLPGLKVLYVRYKNETFEKTNEVLRNRFPGLTVIAPNRID